MTAFDCLPTCPGKWLWSAEQQTACHGLSLGALPAQLTVHRYLPSVKSYPADHLLQSEPADRHP